MKRNDMYLSPGRIASPAEMEIDDDSEFTCDECGVYEYENLRHCKEHNTQYCRLCSCPECREETRE